MRRRTSMPWAENVLAALTRATSSSELHPNDHGEPMQFGCGGQLLPSAESIPLAHASSAESPVVHSEKTVCSRLQPGSAVPEPADCVYCSALTRGERPPVATYCGCTNRYGHRMRPM